MRRLRVFGAVLCAVAAVLGVATGASATTPSSVPHSGTWGVWKSCGTAYPGQNCASVLTTTGDPSAHTLFLGGSFTKAFDPSTGASAAYHNLAAVDDRTGTLISTFRAHTFNGTIRALGTNLAANLLYVGGDFTSIDGSSTAADHLAAFNITTGSRVTGFAPRVNGPVTALLEDTTANLLYVGGRFTDVQGQSRARLAAVDPQSGAVSTGFQPPAISWRETSAGYLADVRALTMGADGSGRRSLYVGGHFDTVNGAPHLSIIRVDPSSGALDAGFTPVLDATADDDLQAVDKIVWLGGTTPGIVVAQAGHTNRAYRFDVSGHRTWYLKPNGDVQTAVVYGGAVYLGGHFRCMAAGNAGSSCYSTTLAHVTRIHIAAVSQSTGAILSGFSPAMNPKTQPYYFGVWTLRVTSDGTLWAGGVFKAVTYQGTTYNRPKLAAFSV